MSGKDSPGPAASPAGKFLSSKDSPLRLFTPDNNSPTASVGGPTGFSTSPSKAQGMAGNAVAATTTMLEHEEQLADALYRRAQAKLLLDGIYEEYGEGRESTALIDGALSDACRVCIVIMCTDEYI